MLRDVTLRNFKAYGPEGTKFEFAPITLILGPNSVGKSTMFQALMALKQTWEVELNGIHSLSCTGRYVDLGSFSNVLYRPSAFEQLDDEREVSISIAWSVPALVDLPASETPTPAGPVFESKATDGDAGNDKPDVPQDRSAYGLREVGLAWLGDVRADGDKVVVRPIENRLVAVTEGASPSLETRMKATTSSDGNVSLEYGHRLVSVLPRSEPVKDPNVGEAASHARPNTEVIAKHEILLERGGRTIATQADGASNEPANYGPQRRLENILALREKLHDIVHIGPLRHAGARLYHPGAPGADFVGYDGRDFVGVLTEDPEVLPERLGKLGASLKSIEIPYDVRLESIVTRTRFAYELLLESTSDRSPEHVVGLPDVGFGISQVLPLLTQYIRDWDAGPISVGGLGTPTRTILVEQPELHLHPLWQANLLRYFCQCLQDARRDDELGVPPQIIMETHSELMVLQVLEMVKRKVVSPEDVSILFIQPDEVRGPQVKRIRVGPDGRELDIWPSGFFPERHRIRSRDA